MSGISFISGTISHFKAGSAFRIPLLSGVLLVFGPSIMAFFEERGFTRGQTLTDCDRFAVASVTNQVGRSRSRRGFDGYACLRSVTHVWLELK
jgi:hypothetical protein